MFASFSIAYSQDQGVWPYFVIISFHRGVKKQAIQPLSKYDKNRVNIYTVCRRV
jgi:hypothetical protein